MDGRFEAPLLQAIVAVAGSPRHARTLAREILNGRQAAIDRIQDGVGSSIRVDDDGTRCMEIELAAGVIWNVGGIVMRAEMLPETIKSTLPGRRLSEIIAHPLIDEGMVVTRVVAIGGLDRIETTGHVRGIGDIAPTSWRPPDDEIRGIPPRHRFGRLGFHAPAIAAIAALAIPPAYLGYPTAAGIFATNAIMLYAAAMKVAKSTQSEVALSRMEQGRRSRLTAPHS